MKRAVGPDHIEEFYRLARVLASRKGLSLVRAFKLNDEVRSLATSADMDERLLRAQIEDAALDIRSAKEHK